MTWWRALQYALAVACGVIAALLVASPALAYSNWGALMEAVPVGFALSLVVNDAHNKRQRRQLLELDRHWRERERKAQYEGHAADTRNMSGHVCGGKLYANRSFCPVHGKDSPARQVQRLGDAYGLPVITPLQKAEALPLCTTVPVSAGGSLVSAVVPLWTEKEEEYVPDGQAELSAMLLEHMRSQWKDAAPSRRNYAYPYPGHWEMNEEWAAEVRKLRAGDGKPLWKQDRYTLMGYCFKFSDEYGAPDLVTP